MRTSIVICGAAMCISLSGCTSLSPSQLPGPATGGRILLPNGWYLSPAGKQLEIGELPLNMVVTPDEHFLITTDDGTAKQTLSIIDLQKWELIQKVPIAKSWLGLRMFDGGKRLLVSGGNDNRVYVYGFNEGSLDLQDSLVVAPPRPAAKVWVAGIDVDESAGLVYAAGKEDRSLNVLRLSDKSLINRISLPSVPYTCLVARSHPYVFVSLWGGASVAFVRKADLRIEKTVPVGDHPCDMVQSPDGKRLFVANANRNTVSVIDIASGTVTEMLGAALYPDLPCGSTPNGLSLSSDGSRLYIANADNNCLAVLDVGHPGHSRSLGFIPTGWYPTCVSVLPVSGRILVANGKGGSGSRANPEGPNPTGPRNPRDYIGSMFLGSVSFIDPPDEQMLGQYTAEVYANSKIAHPPPPPPSASPLRASAESPSPIRHVFYFIKENRTYDQVFGDLPQGNGDSSLCIFGSRVTPNEHALVQEFVLLDNFYVDAEVSADGHNWSMGAYATDYVEKTWPTSYGGRGGDYEFEGGTPEVYPSSGYLWDNCRRNNVSYRTYGEFIHNPSREGDSAQPALPSLQGHVAPFYRGWDLHFSDVDRFSTWEKEFSRYERDGNLPQFQTIKLPNDHTEGTRKGSLTPRAYVAQNDLALGKFVERISHSPYWATSAIFVVEDDAQNGPDHVDAHRTEALVISPYVKRGFVDHELYSTSSMVRTMELILDLPPLSQFDSAATPMENSFTSSPDFTPYTCREAGYDINELNIAGAFGAEACETLNFTREDAVPDLLLSEIVWRSVRGPDSPMPPPVRSAFVRTRGEDDDSR
jgi:YVTN family beta-propeller protein